MAATATDNNSMDAGPSRSLWPLWALAAAMGAAAGVLFAGPVWAHDHALVHTVHVPWFVFVAAFIFGDLHPLDLRFRGETHTYNLSEVVLALGLLATAPSDLVSAQVVAVLIVMVVIERLSPLKIVFNVCQAALGTIAAVVVFHALATSGDVGPRSWLAALVACTCASLVSLLSISMAITVAQRGASSKTILRSIVLGLVGTVVNTMLGLVTFIVLSNSIVGATLLVGPIMVVYIAYRAYLSERTKSEGLQFLYHASELLSGARDLEAGLLALLDFARETFHTEIAEVVLKGEAGEAIGYRTCAGPGDRALRLEPASLDDVNVVLEVASESNATIVHVPTAGTRRDGVEIATMMIAALSDEHGVRGAVVVAREKRSVADPFTKDEQRLFDTFANHLGTTLEKSRLSTSLAQLRALKQELAHQAFHDSLTGLANRALFRERVDTALRLAAHEGTRVAVMFIDLDDFKTVNDTMGHAAGDALLEEVARRIDSCVAVDDTAARLGGDEFAVLLRNVRHDNDVRAVADEILVKLGDPIHIDGQPVVAHASIGIASHAGAADAAELMQHADVAMYTAKRNGKGRFDEFEPNMSLTVARRHQVKMGLERALANGEFVLHYQPLVDTPSGSVTGAEALLRWKDPNRGLVTPSEFVGVAEETGLIVPIGRFVLQQACRQASEWTASMPDLRLFVNLSTRQLADPDLVRDVRTALKESGLDAFRLVLEVTETAMMRDIDEARATLVALKDLGVHIAIDDFGTGFSSLSYLRQLPIDVLKIAKPITDAICESAEDAAFVKGIIELGHVVGLVVVAEGVETVEQYAHLVDMRCDYVQGYFHAPSMAPGDFTALLRTTPPDATARDALNA